MMGISLPDQICFGSDIVNRIDDVIKAVKIKLICCFRQVHACVQCNISLWIDIEKSCFCGMGFILADGGMQ